MPAPGFALAGCRFALACTRFALACTRFALVCTRFAPGSLCLGAAACGGQALAGAVEPVLAVPRKLLADFPQSERLLEGDRPLFEADDDFDEPRPGFLIGEGVNALEGPVAADMAFAAAARFAPGFVPVAPGSAPSASGVALFALGPASFALGPSPLRAFFLGMLSSLWSGCGEIVLVGGKALFGEGPALFGGDGKGETAPREDRFDLLACADVGGV